jgi:hypothetical protein
MGLNISGEHPAVFVSHCLAFSQKFAFLALLFLKIHAIFG